MPEADMAAALELQTLESVRPVRDGMFLFKTLRGMYDCPDLLEMVQLRVPSATRSQDCFAHGQHSSCLATNI